LQNGRFSFCLGLHAGQTGPAAPWLWRLQGAKAQSASAPRRLPGMSTPNGGPGAARRAGRPLPRGRRGPFFAARVFVAKEFENIRAFVYNKPERKQSKATGKRR